MTRTERAICRAASELFRVPEEQVAEALGARGEGAPPPLDERLAAAGLTPEQADQAIAAAFEEVRREADAAARGRGPAASSGRGSNGNGDRGAEVSGLRSLLARLDRLLASGRPIRLVAGGAAPAPGAVPVPTTAADFFASGASPTVGPPPPTTRETGPTVSAESAETVAPPAPPPAASADASAQDLTVGVDSDAGRVMLAEFEKQLQAAPDAPPAPGTFLEFRGGGEGGKLPTPTPSRPATPRPSQPATPPTGRPPTPSGALRQAQGTALRPAQGTAGGGAGGIAGMVGLEKYEIVKEIGRGGMGIVYKAIQKALGRTVCLKVMRGGQLAGSEARKRFLREAESAARLQHPNIVPVHDVGEHEGMVFFSMDFIDGQEFGDWIRENKPGAKELVQVLVKVCEAIQYAHQRGVIHRDLKPANVMVDRSGEPHVMDFGIAKTVDVEQEPGTEKRGGTMTQTGAIMGTPQYMAPEQAKGAISEIDVRTDVYTLGVIGYEVLVGKLPFEAENVYQLLEKVVQDDPVAPTTIKPDLDPDLETIVLKAMEKEKERRYQTAEELRDDLQRWLEGDPILARRASIVYRVRKKVRKHRGVFLMGLAGAAAVLAGAGLLVLKAVGDAVKERARIAALVEGAETERREGRAEKAVLAYQSVLAQEPDHLRAREGLVEAALGYADTSVKEGAPGRAEFVLLSVERIGVRAEEVRSALVRARREKEKIAEMGVRRQSQYVERTKRILADVAAIEAGKDLSPDEAEGHLFDLVSMKDAETAKELSRALAGEQGYSDPRGRLLAAKALGGMGEASGVPALAGAAKDPAAPERLRLAACEALGRIGGEEVLKALVEARKGADAVFKRRTDSALARAHASVERKAADKPKEGEASKDDQVKELFTKADGFRLAGKHDEAIEAYTEALRLAPEAVEGRLGRGTSLLALGTVEDAAKAERDFGAVVDAGGATRGAALLNRAEARRRQRKYDAALADLQELARGEPGNAVAHLALAVVLLEKGGPSAAEAAVAAADRALEAKPGYAEALQARAEAKLAGGLDSAGALADAEAAVAADPAKPEFLIVRARVRTARGLAGMALQDAEKALDRAPAGSPLARVAVAVHGDAALRSGDPATARADFRKLTAEEPDSADNWYDLARAEAALGDADAACEALEKAVAKGHPAARLRGDADLKALEGHPRFERLAGGK